MGEPVGTTGQERRLFLRNSEGLVWVTNTGRRYAGLLGGHLGPSERGSGVPAVVGVGWPSFLLADTWPGRADVLTFLELKGLSCL